MNLFEEVVALQDIRKLSAQFSLKIIIHSSGIKCEGHWVNMRMFEIYIQERCGQLWEGQEDEDKPKTTQLESQVIPPRRAQQEVTETPSGRKLGEQWDQRKYGEKDEDQTEKDNKSLGEGENTERGERTGPRLSESKITTPFENPPPALRLQPRGNGDAHKENGDTQSARDKTLVSEKTQFGKGREQERRETPKDGPHATGHSKYTPSLFHKQELKAPPVVCFSLEKDTEAIETLKTRYRVEILFSYGLIKISGDDQNALKKAEQRLKEELTQIQESMEMHESDVIPKYLREEVKRMIQNQAESITCIINEASERVNALGDSAEEFIREVNLMVRNKKDVAESPKHSLRDRPGKMQEAALHSGYQSFEDARSKEEMFRNEIQVDIAVMKYIAGCAKVFNTMNFREVTMNMTNDGEMGIITLKSTNERKLQEESTKLRNKIAQLEKQIGKEFVELLTKDAIDVRQLIKEFPDVYVDLKEEFLVVELLGPRDLVKTMKQVILARLKGRSTTSAGSRSYSQVLTSSTGASSSDWPTPTSHSTPTPTPSFAEPMSFQAKNGRPVFVHVLVHDITRMQVDAIVNAANEHLDHGGGVAWAIAKAAGKELEDDCKAHIKKHKQVKLTNHFISKAGQLPCSRVMHAVGPRHNNKEQEKGMNQLRNTFHNCLSAANANNYSSIAIPPVSAGIFGFPSYTVATILAKYVGEFVHKPKTKLTDIYIVDISAELITMIQKQMEQQRTLRRCEKFKGESACLPPIGHAGQGGPRRRHRVLDTSGEAGGGSSFGSSTSTTAPSSPRAGGMDRGMDPLFSSGHLPDEASAKEFDEGSSVDPPLSPKDNEDKKKEEEDEDCPICYDSTDLKTLEKCGHKFCKECIKKSFQVKPVCPVCGAVYGEITGNQPEKGQMKNQVTGSSLPGYEQCGTIVIDYHFQGGIQGPEHPKPNRPYSGTSRRAYLPNNTEGRKVLELLKKAFQRRLIFTIGTSVTSGLEDTVTWNDIHHKTNVHGGAQKYGYPDDKYLSRVTLELAAKGVTE